MFLPAGSKLTAKIAVVLVVGLILLSAILYFQKSQARLEQAREDVETLQEQIEVEEKVDEAVRQSRQSNPDRSGSTALERLRERQSDR